MATVTCKRHLSKLQLTEANLRQTCTCVKVASKACEVIRMSGTGVYTEGVANASCSLAAGRTAA